MDILNIVTTFQTARRLSEKTHTLAQYGLSGEWAGQMIVSDPMLKSCLPQDGVSEEIRYALAVKLIAETAPLRVLDDELIIGSATYLEAVAHQTPIYGGSSTSHLTLGFNRALKLGYKGLSAEIKTRLSQGGLDERGVNLLNSMLVCIEAAGIWHHRHVELLRQRIKETRGNQQAHYRHVLENIENIPENPPETFHEAVQALWFYFAFQRLCGNWSGLGRIDQMLGSYLEQDLAGGKISLDEAREILAHFWIHGTEWAGIQKGSGDAQHYQNIVLSGVDAAGVDITNAVTYLVLDIVEELHISDFPVAVRVNQRTPDQLLRRIAEVQRMGGGIVSVYNEGVVIKGLVDLGIPLEDARGFANDGCWEAIIPGKTAFIYHPFDTLEVLQAVMGLNTPAIPDDAAAATAIPIPEYPDFETFYAHFIEALGQRVEHIHAGFDHSFSDGRPATLISLLIEDCIEKGKGYTDRGAHYVFNSPHAGGMADAANSLLVIKKLVFEEKLLSFQTLVETLRSDWEDQEMLRRQIRATIPLYGNDNDEADALMQRLFNDYTSLVWKVSYRAGVHRPAGISTFGREIEWRSHRKAAAHGFRLGALLATNFSPTPGTDMEGPTAVIRSYCKMNFARLPNGGTLELKIHPSTVNGEEGLLAVMGLLKTFVRLGGFYLNIDVIDTATLIDAQQHPEKYPNLAVRISGWCARFNTLNKEWQDMIIQRTQQV